jgi:hypothetical protein
MLSKISQTGKDKHHVFSHIQNLDRKKEDMKYDQGTLFVHMKMS